MAIFDRADVLSERWFYAAIAMASIFSAWPGRFARAKSARSLRYLGERTRLDREIPHASSRVSWACRCNAIPLPPISSGLKIKRDKFVLMRAGSGAIREAHEAI
jgi:hypothetical protein